VTLQQLHGSYAICRLSPGETLPPWVTQSRFFSITRTPAEFSIVCDVEAVPAGVKADAPWLVLAVRGPLDLSMTGVLSGLTTPLAAAGVSIFAVSTFDTDYLLVRQHDGDRARRVLRDAGHEVLDA
jgi:hypothetical protein